MGTMEPKIAGPKAPQDKLSSYFDDSVATVRQKFTHFEKDYVLPIVDLITALFLAYPVSFGFLSIFATLSFFPVLAFIAVSIATLSTALTLALCLAFAFSAGVFLLLGGVLLFTLGLALLLSAFLTGSAISVYLSGRLVLLLRRFGRSGFSAWSQEVTRIFFPSSAHLVPVDDDQDTSEDSGTLVGRDTKDSYTTKMDISSSEHPDTELKHVT